MSAYFYFFEPVYHQSRKKFRVKVCRLLGHYLTVPRDLSQLVYSGGSKEKCRVVAAGDDQLLAFGRVTDIGYIAFRNVNSQYPAKDRRMQHAHVQVLPVI